MSSVDMYLTTSKSYRRPRICTIITLQSLDSPAKGAHLLTNVALVFLNILLSLLGVMMNVLVVTAYSRNRRLRTPCNMLLVILAYSDLMVCAVAQPVYIGKKLTELFVVLNCFLWLLDKLVFYCCCGVSLMIVVVLSVERFVTLAYPYHYQNIITPNRLKIMAASLSFSVCTLAFCQLVPLPYHAMPAIGATVILLSMALVVAIWLWIHRLISRHRNCIDVCQTPSHTFTAMRNINKKVVQTTKMSHLIAGGVVLCYFPSFVSHIYYLLQSKNNLDVYIFMMPWMDTLVFVNSLLNPLILLYWKREFRTTAKSLLNK